MTRSGSNVSGSCQAIHLYANTECIRLVTACGVARWLGEWKGAPT